MTTNLGARAVAGGRVVAITQFLRFGLQILGMIALSWLVSPADFGLVAVVVAVLGIADVGADEARLIGPAEVVARGRVRISPGVVRGAGLRGGL